MDGLLEALRAAKQSVDTLSDDEFRTFVDHFMEWFEDDDHSALLAMKSRSGKTAHIMSADPIAVEGGLLDCIHMFMGSAKQ